jgi:hypothetical protein
MSKIEKNNKVSFVLVLILSLYPILRSSFEMISSDSRKLSEIIIGINFYIVMYLGYVISLKRILLNYFKVIYSLIPFCLINFVIILICKFLFAAEKDSTGYNYLMLSNCLLPLSFLIFNSKNKRHFYLGYIFSSLALFLASFANSRSYTLVSVLVIVLATLNSMEFKKNINIFRLSLVFVVLFLFFQFSSKSDIGEKFQFESLFPVIGNVVSNGDLLSLWEWEGNSRQNIVADAFLNFTSFQWIFGKGISGSYDSFVERSVIEIGFLNEMFRWGISYLIILILSYIFIFFKSDKLKSTGMKFFILSIVFIRFVDGFIYGANEGNLYNLLFFTLFFYYFNHYSLYVTDSQKVS